MRRNYFENRMNFIKDDVGIVQECKVDQVLLLFGIGGKDV